MNIYHVHWWYNGQGGFLSVEARSPETAKDAVTAFLKGKIADLDEKALILEV